MTKLKLNPDYARRHLFVTVLMLALGVWFAYDGLVRYPSLSAEDLYRSIEKADPPVTCNLEAFKRQKTQTQYGFAALALLAGVVVGLRLLKARQFDFAFDADQFEWSGRTYTREQVREADTRLWKKKGILTLHLDDGSVVALDAWHHTGVKEFVTQFKLSD